MLKNIPKILSPELLKTIAEMGHGDEIVLADGNFPAASCSSYYGKRLIRCDSTNIPLLLEAILQLFPLDEFVSKPVAVMQRVDQGQEPPIWQQYRNIIAKQESKKYTELELVERFAFYERTKKAYAVIATSEQSLYANIILKKGIIRNSNWSL